MHGVRRAELLATAAGSADYPSEGSPEIALLGRSNVGKSSLLNRMVGRRQLARTSGAPGKTRLVNFFRVERRTGALLLVDLPGYGYARVSRSERMRWRGLVEDYLDRRRALRGAVLLRDLRRDDSDDERDLLGWLAQREVPVIVALTKVDKLKPMRRAERVRELSAGVQPGVAGVVATSARTGHGIDALWKAIDALL